LILEIDCIPCILDDVRGAVELLTDDEKVKFKVMKQCLEFLSDGIDQRKEPSKYITEAHRIVKKVCGIEIPFAQKRRMCNQLGLDLEKKIEPILESTDKYEAFSLLVRWSIAGNSLDFRTVGTGYDFDIDSIHKELISLVDSLDIDQTEQIYDMVRSADTILFVHDNVGEIVLDKLLIRHIKRLGDAKVISAVRGGPITSDATMDDAEQVRLSEASDSVIIAGPDTLGISFDEMSEEFADRLADSDLIIAKGQANYYVFSEHKDQLECRVACLFRTKCRLVSGLFNHPTNINIASLI